MGMGMALTWAWHGHGHGMGMGMGMGRVRTIVSEPLTPYSLLLTTYCLPLPTYHLLRTTYHLLLTIVSELRARWQHLALVVHDVVVVGIALRDGDGGGGVHGGGLFLKSVR
jgi:hypothetical protein